jgi:hypothetical protein
MGDGGKGRQGAGSREQGAGDGRCEDLLKLNRTGIDDSISLYLQVVWQGPANILAPSLIYTESLSGLL